MLRWTLGAVARGQPGERLGRASLPSGAGPAVPWHLLGLLPLSPEERIVCACVL